MSRFRRWGVRCACRAVHPALRTGNAVVLMARVPRWDSIEIGSLRRLTNLRLEGLRGINLIVGPNNSGKTTVLEAVRLLGNPLDAWTWVDTSRSREIKSGRVSSLESLRYLFTWAQGSALSGGGCGRVLLKGEGRGISRSVAADLRESRYESAGDIGGTGTEGDGEDRRGVVGVKVSAEGATYAVEFEVDRRKDFQPPPPPAGVLVAPTRFLSPVHHRVDLGTIRTLSELLEGSLKGTLLKRLREVDETIQDVLVVVREGRGPEIRVLRDGAVGVPLSNEGDGVRRMLGLAAEAFASLVMPPGRGVLLVDEIETALHPTAMEKALRVLKSVSDDALGSGDGVQIFATSHSLEVMDAVARVWGESGGMPGTHADDPVAFYRLPAVGSGGDVVRYSLQEYLERREEVGMDIR